MPTAKTYATLILFILLILIAVNLQAGWIFLLSAFILGDIIVSLIENRKTIKRVAIDRTTSSRGEASKPHLFIYYLKDPPPVFTIKEESISAEFSALGATIVSFEIFLKRGIYELNELFVTTAYPSGWFRSFKKIENSKKIVIWPEKDEISPSFAKEIGLARDMGTGHTSRKGNEYAGVREFKSGDPIKKIHWKKSASRAQLYVREDAGFSTKKVLVYLNNHLSVPEELFEHCVSCARTVSEYLFSLGLNPVLACFSRNGINLIDDDITKINDFLAEVERVDPNFEYNASRVELEGLIQEKAACMFISAVEWHPLCLSSFRDSFFVYVYRKGEIPAQKQFSRTIFVEVRGSKRKWVY